MANYLSDTDAAILVHSQWHLPAGDVAAYLAVALPMIEARINYRCGFSTSTTDTAIAGALESVEYNALLKILQNTRLSNEGVPAEVKFNDRYFSSEDLELMQEIKSDSWTITIDSASKTELI